MCEEIRTVSFRESFRDVDYEVQAICVEDGVEMMLPRYGTFECMIETVGQELSREEIKMTASAEYEKCLIETVRRLRGGLE